MDEPPTGQKGDETSTALLSPLKKNSEKDLRKEILLNPEENKYIPPKKLKTDNNFKRLGILNPAVVQNDENKEKITLFPRLIYQDSKGRNSCIIKRQAVLEGHRVKILPGEETIFQAGFPHGEKGVEDFKVTKLVGEDPLHGFLVYYNGFDMRTGYVRTLGENPKDYSTWDKFGIFFPNIKAQKAISLVKQDRYKKYWEYLHGKEAIKRAKSENKFVPKNPFLGVKDCCLFPRKVKRKEENGNLREYYGVIIRLFPDMQIIYVKGFKELASQKFWHNTIKNLENFVLLKRENKWEQSHIGLGGVPIELKDGVLIPYHGVVMNPIRDYRAGAVLVDKNDPQKIIARTKKPINFATESWESNGLVNGNIVFPTAYAISSEGIIHDFYGAGDKYIGHRTTKEKTLLEKLVAV